MVKDGSEEDVYHCRDGPPDPWRVAEVKSTMPDMADLCGIDEVGRGPLAGPVTAAAVVLPPGFPTGILADSKRLSAQARESARRQIAASGQIGVGWVWPEEIDLLNIHHATLLAMKRAFEALDGSVRRKVDRVAVDGKYAPDLASPDPNGRTWHGDIVTVVGGDHLIPEIMAASIVAKVTRDRWMMRYGWIEPGYGYEQHAGYPTEAHRRYCIEHGPSPIQRMSFRIKPPKTRARFDIDA